MASKGAKESLVAKLGFKSNSSAPKIEAEMERVRKENAHLRRKIDDLAKRHVRPPDSDKTKLLERILSLETLRERNSQQLMVKEQEMENLRQQLSAKGGEVVASLQNQLDQRRKEVECRERLFQSLSQETEELKNKLVVVSARCQTLETQVATTGQAPPADLAAVQEQLRDALEKNQQWLTYDQQREAFVQSVLARTRELESQLAQAQQQPSKEEADTKAAATCSDKNDDQLKSCYEQLLSGMQTNLEEQKDQTFKAQQELFEQREQTLRAQDELRSQKERMSALQRNYDDRCRELTAIQRKCDDRSRELEEAKEQLQMEQAGNRNAVSEQKRLSSERMELMRSELESVEVRLEEERKRSAELLLQMNLLQKSLLSQNEERMRIVALEQQFSSMDDDKADRQNMQHQLQKVLKELRKAREQIAKMEANKQQSACFFEPTTFNKLEHLTIEDPLGPTSPSNTSSLLDESFLECPRCHISYPARHYKELLAHVDYCLA